MRIIHTARAVALSLALLLALACPFGALAESVPALDAPIGQLPILLTSVGQSADVEMVRVMLEKSEIESTIDKLATEDSLAGYATLILAVGGSSKGLGAAGIDANQELERVEKLIKAADEAGLVIIAMHVGGSARRGDLSDKFIPMSFNSADYAIIVEEGDKDGLMKGLATEAGIPFTYVGTMVDAVAPLKAVFVG